MSLMLVSFSQELWDRVVGDQKALLAYPYMITQIYLTAGVLELPGIDKMIEVWRKFDINLITYAAKPFTWPMRQTKDVMAGLFPQNDQTDSSSIFEDTEAWEQTEGTYIDSGYY